MLTSSYRTAASDLPPVADRQQALAVARPLVWEEQTACWARQVEGRSENSDSVVRREHSVLLELHYDGGRLPCWPPQRDYLTIALGRPNVLEPTG
jgi:hypothetical protein